MTNTCLTPVTVVNANDNSPNFTVISFKPKTIKPGKSKTLSVKVLCDRFGTFFPPFGVSFTTSDGKTVGPASYEFNVTPTSVEQFSLNSVDVTMSEERVEFKLTGRGIESAQVTVYDLSGKRVFDSSRVSSQELQWNLLNDDGQLVPNGVYLYILHIWGYNGEVIKQIHKFVVQH
ncbi:MAG: hypothetical protein QXI19_12115 [Candidatus Caldarchaeum sp.]